MGGGRKEGEEGGKVEGWRETGGKGGGEEDMGGRGGEDERLKLGRFLKSER